MGTFPCSRLGSGIVLWSTSLRAEQRPPVLSRVLYKQKPDKLGSTSFFKRKIIFLHKKSRLKREGERQRKKERISHLPALPAISQHQFLGSISDWLKCKTKPNYKQQQLNNDRGSFVWWKRRLNEQTHTILLCHTSHITKIQSQLWHVHQASLITTLDLNIAFHTPSNNSIICDTNG